ncbi:MAG: hypothetical protein EOO10_17710 [Chitinophagaceae bacterium]|nr:MAG: hypothetical protein EOO10_17710 [Chitinophagaceae bacterium]
MKTIPTLKPRKTALAQISSTRGYTKKDLWQTFCKAMCLTEEEAEQVLNRTEIATVLELILCKALLNAIKAGEEAEMKFRKRLFRHMHRTLCLSVEENDCK